METLKDYPAVENPFKIEIAHNEPMNGFDVVLQVGGLRDEKEAKQFAECLAEWMTAEGGWKQRFQ
jgi:hypothetical protein